MFTALSILPAITLAKPISAIIYPNDAKITEYHTTDVQSDGDRLTAQFFLPIHAKTETLSVNTNPGPDLRITSVTIEEKMMPVADQVEKLNNPRL